MKSIRYEEKKLLTEMRFHYEGEIHIAENMTIDTCALYTTISPALANKLGIPSEMKGKDVQLNSISIGPLKVSPFTVYIEDTHKDGVIGLDFLKKTGAKINLDAMTISSSRT
ncbi:retropepsin-like aspartic protease [Salisediminibacterium halotolerans]|uniref:Gag-polyprotein putative aspartyl protease n=1 Tax=Salisediminibacterium halotolerans TaxID=517425 RepID=A0A1H9RS76_9BACI|nr:MULTISPECIES: retropepsin-like aspartic protease [Salisediminibacterium]RLJ81061.1 gag-polyprotein putative aspartyl protease [Actinophytocola xinjiangensis]RPE87849.1 gag-polyprotein putative aspartyl protease [Salisediminibacterium halotolerans]TWG37954.1 gag-polyprotein putative aspartyl protease [Salisediminibacterium halotolerans]SER75444.1 gag-polyprotein putative aspartyl protease [Salisediminibacterium haloalkalitolerans]GEL09024.1 hypothetical protein SHA02_24400 [Salisediminibacte